MQCPSCKNAGLVSHRLEYGFYGYTCARCQGQLISLGPYVDWAVEQQDAVPDPKEAFEPQAHDSKGALLCPKCTRLMVRYKVAADSTHGLDYCFSCEEVWLDGGEWNYLKSKGLHTKITAISTEGWQRKIREEYGTSVRLEKFRRAIGEDAFTQVEQFRTWLATQPARAEILRYLNVAD